MNYILLDISNAQSKQTLNTAQSRLKKLCQFATSNDWIEKNYLADVTPIKVSKADKQANKYKVLSDTDIRSILNGHLYNPSIKTFTSN